MLDRADHTKVKPSKKKKAKKMCKNSPVYIEPSEDELREMRRYDYLAECSPKDPVPQIRGTTKFSRFIFEGLGHPTYDPDDCD